MSTDDTSVLAVVVEIQMGRDRDKRFSWPVYLVSLRARLRCPTVLLVVCVDEAVAAWCAQPIELGHPGLRLAPLVLGPDRVPIVSEPDEARRSPELAVLSAMAQGVVEGEANALFTVLETRGVPVTDTARTRIAECRDPVQLDTWLRRAITVDSVDELFA